MIIAKLYIVTDVSNIDWNYMLQHCNLLAVPTAETATESIKYRKRSLTSSHCSILARARPYEEGGSNTTKYGSCND